MIAKIETTTQYGKAQFSGINHMAELDGEPIVSYGHSLQDAKEWLLAFPLFENAEVVDTGAATVVKSQWMPRDTMLDEIFEDGLMKTATHERHQVVINPVNTIYENAGLEKFRK